MLRLSTTSTKLSKRTKKNTYEQLQAYVNSRNKLDDRVASVCRTNKPEAVQAVKMRASQAIMTTGRRDGKMMLTIRSWRGKEQELEH